MRVCMRKGRKKLSWFRPGKNFQCWRLLRKKIAIAISIATAMAMAMGISTAIAMAICLWAAYSSQIMI